MKKIIIILTVKTAFDEVLTVNIKLKFRVEGDRVIIDSYETLGIFNGAVEVESTDEITDLIERKFRDEQDNIKVQAKAANDGGWAESPEETDRE